MPYFDFFIIIQLIMNLIIKYHTFSLFHLSFHFIINHLMFLIKELSIYFGKYPFYVSELSKRIFSRTFLRLYG